MVISVNRVPQRQLERTAVGPQPLPSRGGTPYPVGSRILFIRQYENGELRRPFYRAQQNHGIVGSDRSARRWRRRVQQFGHLRPFRRNGNKRATTLCGLPLQLLALLRAAYPEAHKFEISAFLWNAYSRLLPNPRFYNPSEIHKAERKLELTRKRCSVSARQASLLRNQIKRYVFWHFPYPDGIADIPRERMIDLDEMGVELHTAARHYGVGTVGESVQITGPYGREGKLTVLMAIFGRAGQIDRFVDIEQRPGTGVYHMFNFIRNIIETIGDGTNDDNRYCFTMDNLSAHKHPAILGLILMHGHRYVFRAPYYPVDGPIEYVFDTIENDLRARMYRIFTMQDIENELWNIINTIDNFENYFAHVGFN